MTQLVQRLIVQKNNFIEFNKYLFMYISNTIKLPILFFYILFLFYTKQLVITYILI
jgi:hypothetical protein